MDGTLMDDGLAVGSPQHDPPAAPNVAGAERAVARAEVAFSASLHDASQAGRETVERVVAAVRPLLIGVGLLAGALLAIRLLRGLRTARGFRLSSRLPSAPAARPLGAELARSLAPSIAATVGRRLAERWVGVLMASQPATTWQSGVAMCSPPVFLEASEPVFRTRSDA
jgi:hypothetical protein